MPFPRGAPPRDPRVQGQFLELGDACLVDWPGCQFDSSNWSLRQVANLPQRILLASISPGFAPLFIERELLSGIRHAACWWVAQGTAWPPRLLFEMRREVIYSRKRCILRTLIIERASYSADLRPQGTRPRTQELLYSGRLTADDLRRVNLATIREGVNHCRWPREVIERFLAVEV